MDKTNHQLFWQKRTVLVKLKFTLGVFEPAEESTRMFVNVEAAAELLKPPLNEAREHYLV